MISDGSVYTAGDGTVRQYALANGAPGWTYTSPDPFTRVVAAENSTVYVWTALFDFGPPAPSNLRALRTSNGSQKWSQDLQNHRVGTVAVTGSLVWVTLTQIFNQGRSSILTALHRRTGTVLAEKYFDDNMYNWTGGAAFGGGKVVVDQGGSAGDPEPRRLRVFGVAGVRPTVETDVLEMGRVGKPYSQQLTPSRVGAPRCSGR